MQRIGNTRYIDVNNEEADHIIVLFHGYGADCYDLQTLSDVIQTPWKTRWIFPQGPLEVPIGPGWTGHAWWEINMAAFQESSLKNEPRDLSIDYPLGLKKIRPQMLDFIKKLNTPMDKIILGGFSQGAMLAMDLFLHLEEEPKGLILLSGALLCENDWKPLLAKKSKAQYFISHGTKDPVLSFKGSQRLENLLKQNGLKGKIHLFSGAHEIPNEVIQKTNVFLQGLK